MISNARRTRSAYVDASVFGGAYDEEFEEDNRAFFQQVEQGRFVVLTSGLVADEVARAPAEAHQHFERVLSRAELVGIDEAAFELQHACLEAGIVTAKWADDALHVALATVAGADLIVSWNFRNIVHFDKVPKHNAVNRLHGYRDVAIHSPSEVIAYEDDEDV